MPSTYTIVLSFAILLYATVSLPVLRFLLPRFSPGAKRLALVMLAAQVALILFSQPLTESSKASQWLWNLTIERNIPNALASSQLALVCAVALLTACFARERPLWRRLYLFGIAVVFYHLARDEFYVWNEWFPDWKARYAVVGAAVVVATVLVAARSPRRTWVWHICLLGGLAMSAAGAIVLDEPQFAALCLDERLMRSSGCLLANIEESFELSGIWLTLIAMLGQYSEALPRPGGHLRRFLYLLPFLWTYLLFAPDVITLIEYRFFTRPTAIEYEKGVELQAFRLHQSDRSFHLRFFSLVENWHAYTGWGYSFHLVDQVSGKSIAGIDSPAYRLHSLQYLAPSSRERAYKQWIILDVPDDAPQNRAYWLVLTAVRKAGDAYLRQRIISSDHELLGDTQVILGETVFPAQTVASSKPPIAVFNNGISLAEAEMPERAQPGDLLAISVAWQSDKDIGHDYVQYMHFGHEESGEWWVYDRQPLGRRLPTRLWYSGLSDRAIWEIPLPADLAPGRYSVFTGLYRRHDRQRLPVSASAGGAPLPDARLPLGVLTIETS